MPERDSRKGAMTHPSSRTIGDDSSSLRTIVLFGPARASIVLRTIDCPIQCSDWRRMKYNVRAQYVTHSHVLLGLARAGMGCTIGVRDPELPKRDTSKIGRDSR